MKEITMDELIEQLEVEAANEDYEMAHGNADDLLLDIIKLVVHKDDYVKIAEAYDEVGKWYA